MNRMIFYELNHAFNETDGAFYEMNHAFNETDDDILRKVACLYKRSVWCNRQHLLSSATQFAISIITIMEPTMENPKRPFLVSFIVTPTTYQLFYATIAIASDQVWRGTLVHFGASAVPALETLMDGRFCGTTKHASWLCSVSMRTYSMHSHMITSYT